MSSFYDVYNGLRGQLVTQLYNIVPDSSIVIGYPADAPMLNSGQITQAQSTFAPQFPLVTLYDRGFSQDVTRWLPRYISSWSNVPPGVTFSAASVFVPPGGTGTISVLTSAAPNDTAGVTIQNNALYGATTFFATPASAATVAAQIAAVVGGAFGGVLSATDSGSAITFANSSGNAVTVQLSAANVATNIFEVHRVKRHAQIIALTNSPQMLDTVGEPITQMLGQMEIYYGYTLPDGSMVRVINTADACFWDNALNNIARRDWLVDLEYGVTIKDNGYEVLAAIENISISQY